MRLTAEGFDLAISEYGACLWADPVRWVPEAARLLRPDGRLIFLTNSVLLMLCMPDTGDAGDHLLRDAFGMYRVAWSDSPRVEFHLSHGDRIRLLATRRPRWAPPEPPRRSTMILVAQS